MYPHDNNTTSKMKLLRMVGTVHTEGNFTAIVLKKRSTIKR